MPTATLIRPASVTDDNWTASAGSDEATAPRVARPPFTYHGAGDPHWLDQPCTVLAAQTRFADPDEREVVFACGCRSVVPVSTLVRIAD
jgi:hypothetical protein